MAEPATTRPRPRSNGSSSNGAAVTERVPQTDLAAEAAVLSAVTLAPDTLDEVRDILEPDDFYSGPHRTVYEALLEVDRATTRIDIVTLAARLRAMGKLEMIGGTAFLSQLVDATPTVANVLEHARMVRELGMLRRMAVRLRELAFAAQRPETRADVGGFLERCEAEVYAGTIGREERDAVSTLHEMMHAAATALDPTRPREARGMSTGLHELDELTMGMRPGELWYLAARPGMGKTALALGMAAAAASTGAHSAVMFSMEMERPDLSERMISSRSGVPYKSLVNRTLSEAHWQQAIGAMNELAQYPMVVDDTSSLTPSRLRSRLRRHLSKLRNAHPHTRPGIVVVDYVQLMGDDTQGERHEQLERISRALKLMAKEFAVCVVALSQLNRGLKDRADKRPTPYDLRGSGALEQDADKILFIHRAEAAEGEERGDAELILAKGRNAGQGNCAVIWQPWCVRFIDREQAGFEWGPTNYGD